MAIWVQTRTFFILAALLGRFVTTKAQEEEEYDGGEFLSIPLKKYIIIPPLCMQCAYCVIWIVSGMENLWGTRVTRLLLLYAEKGAARFALWASDQKVRKLGFCGARRGRGAGGTSRRRVLPPSTRAEATGKFATKERAWDGAEGRLRGWRAAGQAERGEVNTEASQGGVVCTELHLLSHILCFREIQERGFHPLSPPLSFSSSFLSFSVSFLP